MTFGIVTYKLYNSWGIWQLFLAVNQLSCVD